MICYFSLAYGLQTTVVFSNKLSGLIRRLTDRKCGLIAIKQRKRYLLPDLSNVGQCNRLKENWKEKKSKWINTQTTINS